MAPLKLGKLPDRKTTKITFTASADLNALLTDYADAYEQEYGQHEALAGLIPHMLEAFIKADRGFKRKDISSKIERKTGIQKNHTPSFQKV